MKKGTKHSALSIQKMKGHNHSAAIKAGLGSSPKWAAYVAQRKTAAESPTYKISVGPGGTLSSTLQTIPWARTLEGRLQIVYLATKKSARSLPPYEEFRTWALNCSYPSLYEEWKKSGFHDDLAPIFSRRKFKGRYNVGNLFWKTKRQANISEAQKAVAQSHADVIAKIEQDHKADALKKEWMQENDPETMARVAEHRAWKKRNEERERALFASMRKP